MCAHNVFLVRQLDTNGYRRSFVSEFCLDFEALPDAGAHIRFRFTEFLSLSPTEARPP